MPTRLEGQSNRGEHHPAVSMAPTQSLAPALGPDRIRALSVRTRSTRGSGLGVERRLARACVRAYMWRGRSSRGTGWGWIRGLGFGLGWYGGWSGLENMLRIDCCERLHCVLIARVQYSDRKYSSERITIGFLVVIWLGAENELHIFASNCCSAGGRGWDTLGGSTWRRVSRAHTHTHTHIRVRHSGAPLTLGQGPHTLLAVWQ